MNTNPRNPNYRAPVVGVRAALAALIGAPDAARATRDAAIARANEEFAKSDRSAVVAFDAWLADTIAAASAPTDAPYVIDPALARPMAEVPGLFAALASPPGPTAWWVALTTAHASTRAALAAMGAA